jgi:uncharacterized protein
MEFQSFCISQKEKERIREELTQRISEQDEVLFAFIFGSFQDVAGNMPFRDIDVGIFIKEIGLKEAVYYALDLSQHLSSSISYPVDVRIINEAPIPFLFHVIQGKLIVNKDDDLTSDFMENVIRRYLDMKLLLHMAAKEAFAS